MGLSRVCVCVCVKDLRHVALCSRLVWAALRENSQMDATHWQVSTCSRTSALNTFVTVCVHEGVCTC